MAGICDVSYKSGKLLYPYAYSHETPNLLDHLQQKCIYAYDKLSTITDCPVVCDVIGMDLVMFNKRQYEDDYLQDVIDETMPSLNNWLHAFLKSKPHQPISPFYASYVYKRRNQKTACRYYKATIDGLHYTDYYLHFIANELLSTTRKNKFSIHPEAINLI